MKGSNGRGGGFAAIVGGRYWRETEAKAVLGEWARSGLELKEFARRHGLKPRRLRDWAGRLGQPQMAEFHRVEVRLDGLATPEPLSGTGGVEVVLRGGRRIAVSRGFDEGLLSRLVGVVESWPC